MATNGNGHGPRAVNVPQGIPIIGQPFELVSWAGTFVFTCSCGKGKPVMVIGGVGAAGKCDGCSRIVQVRGVKTIGPRIELDLGVGIAPDVKDGDGTTVS